MRRIGKYIREQPLESSCWCYLLLTVLPGVLWQGEGRWAAEAVFRYLLPGGAACAAAVRFYGASVSALSLRGFCRSFLYCCPIAGLCLVNLLLGGWPEAVRPEQIFWIACCALGEEVMGRMLLFSGAALGAEARGWGKPAAIVLSAVVFGLMHAVNYVAQGTAGTLIQCCYTAGIGALFAWSYQKSGCLWGGIVWHALLNLTAMPMASSGGLLP